MKQRRSRSLTLVSTAIMTVLWFLLWGAVNIPLALLGIAVSLLISLVFPMPPITFRGVFRPRWWLAMFVRFLWDLVASSLSVVRLVFRPKLTLRNAVIKVPLRMSSELIMTQVAGLVTLVPGSVALEVRRNKPRMYVHVLDVTEDNDAIARMYDSVRQTEARVIRYLGPRDAYDRVRAESQQGLPEGEGR